MELVARSLSEVEADIERPGHPLRSASAPRERPRQHVTKPQAFQLSTADPRRARPELPAAVAEGRWRWDPKAKPGPRPYAAVERAARLARLAQPRTALWELCAARKREGNGEALRECSFAPRTGRAPAHCVGGLPAPERLLHQHASKAQQWQRLRMEQEQRELQGCTFAPRLTARAKEGAYTPLPQRVGELQRLKREKLLQAQLAAEERNAELTFSPAINGRSARIAERRGARPALGARPNPATSGAPEDTECTFAPALNPASEALLEGSAAVPADFFRRQRHFHDLQQRRLAALQSQDDGACTFTPDIGSTSACWERGPEVAADAAERLAIEARRRVEAARSAAADAYYSQFSFRPRLCARSLQLARQAPRAFRELASDAPTRAGRAAAAAEAEARLAADCTFRPRLCAPPTGSAKSGAGPGGVGRENEAPRLHDQVAHMEEQRRQRQAALEAQRAARERAELAQCTFTPAVLPAAPPAPQGPVLVRGLDRHLGLRDAARKLEAERREREERAFLLHPRGPPAPHTVPQPFELATERNTPDRRAAARAAAAAAAAAERSHAQ
ncbi:hypothetical protein WJX81_003613 [Elliptochloris bilobata]|uniref:TPX2 C-terminal domain-containing protein n=1 Tax=Elliptochloris bilobata TaxID=381761 RepID=A0AAW1RZN2_9CHLO